MRWKAKGTQNVCRRFAWLPMRVEYAAGPQWVWLEFVGVQQPAGKVAPLPAPSAAPAPKNFADTLSAAQEALKHLGTGELRREAPEPACPCCGLVFRKTRLIFP